MAAKQINQLPAGSANAAAVVAADNAELTETQKITIGDIVALVNDASQLTSGTLDDARLSANVILANDPRWLALAPLAPTGLTATEGDMFVALEWVAPSSLLDISDYVIEFSDDNGATWTVASDGTSADTTANVTGLTNDTTYRFRVAAVSGVGAGPFSETATATPTIPVGDPYFSSVSLLLPFDGTGSTFTDFSGTPKTISFGPNGSGVTQTTAQSKFGGSSALFDGSNLKASVGAAPEGTEDFTIEFWHLYDSSQNPYDYQQDIVSTTNAYSGSVVPFHLKTKRLEINGATVMSFPGISSLSGQWYHGALVRQGNTFRFYRDGVELANGTSTASLSSTDLYIGSLPFYSANGIAGSHLDDLRVTRGVCRYPDGLSFTPPTAAFPTQ